MAERAENRSNSEAALVHLAKEINDHDQSRRACEVKGLMHGMRIGQLLLEAKQVVPHGGFLDWVRANTGVTPRMCQMYMKVAGSARLQWMLEHEYETVSHLTLAKAVQLDRQPKAQEEEKARKDYAQRINAQWAAAAEVRRELVGVLSEVQRSFKAEGVPDDDFKAWLVANARIRPTFADKIPHLLSAEYDDQAWSAALLDELLVDLADCSSPHDALAEECAP